MDKVLTIRNVPPEVMSAIKERSRSRGVSANKAVISLLEERVGTRRGHAAKESHRDLDHLAGRWSDGEATELERAFSEIRSVDQELWR